MAEVNSVLRPVDDTSAGGLVRLPLLASSLIQRGRRTRSRARGDTMVWACLRVWKESTADFFLKKTRKEKKRSDRKDAKDALQALGLRSPEDEGRVEGLKSSSAGEKRKVGEAVMQKSDMKTGRGRGRD